MSNPSTGLPFILLRFLYHLPPLTSPDLPSRSAHYFSSLLFSHLPKPLSIRSTTNFTMRFFTVLFTALNAHALPASDAVIVDLRHIVVRSCDLESV